MFFVAKPTSAHARVCFELNAAAVVVAVLVLRHTSSSFTRVWALPGALLAIDGDQTRCCTAATIANRGIDIARQHITAASSSGTQVQQAAH